MKYTLTISEMTADQAMDAINKLNGAVIQNDIVQQSTVNQDTIQPAHVATLVYEVTPTDGVVDSQGMMWDARIHASTKTKNADGRWKKRKGVSESVMNDVETELQQRAAGYATAQPTPGDILPALPVVPQIPLQEMPQAAPIAAPVATVTPAAPVEVAPKRDFQGLMQQISKLFHTQQITPDYPATIVARVNDGFSVKLNTITDVANDPRMVEYAWQCLEVDKKAA